MQLFSGKRLKLTGFENKKNRPALPSAGRRSVKIQHEKVFFHTNKMLKVGNFIHKNAKLYMKKYILQYP